MEAGITDFQKSSDEKPICQMGKNLILMGKKGLVNIFHIKHDPPTETIPVCSPLLVFSLFSKKACI